MKINRPILAALAALAASPALAAEPMMLGSVADPDKRQLVEMPPAARNTLRTEMLERLQALQQIMQAVAEGRPQEAAMVARSGIGMGVMMRHEKRAPEAIPRKYMPEGMMPLSRQSHMLGDELAEALKSGDRARIDGKLREVLGNCVACHNLYRVF